MKKIARTIAAWWPFSAAVPGEEDGGDAELQHAWSISARVAALPSGSIAAAPPDVAALIREAQSLHPGMAEKQLLREQGK